MPAGAAMNRKYPSSVEVADTEVGHGVGASGVLLPAEPTGPSARLTRSPCGDGRAPEYAGHEAHVHDRLPFTTVHDRPCRHLTFTMLKSTPCALAQADRPGRPDGCDIGAESAPACRPWPSAITWSSKLANPAFRSMSATTPIWKPGRCGDARCKSAGVTAGISGERNMVIAQRFGHNHADDRTVGGLVLEGGHGQVHATLLPVTCSGMNLPTQLGFDDLRRSAAPGCLRRHLRRRRSSV